LWVIRGNRLWWDCRMSRFGPFCPSAFPAVALIVGHPSQIAPRMTHDHWNARKRQGTNRPKRGEPLLVAGAFPLLTHDHGGGPGGHAPRHGGKGQCVVACLSVD